MPFKSEAQRRLFHAKAERGEISEKKVREWEHETPKKVKENLPYHVKKSAEQIADEICAELSPATKTSSVNGILAKIAAGVAAFKANPAVGRKELLTSFKKKPAAGIPTEQPKSIEWRKSMGQKPEGEPEMLKFFSLKEGAGPFSKGLPTEKPFMQSTPAAPSPASAVSRQIGGGGMAGSPSGGGGMGGGGRTGTASVDPAVLEASLMRAEGGGASKIWQGLTGLSDDILAAGMRAKEKSDRQAQKHAAHQLAASVSMLTKMSDVSKKDVAGFFRDNPNPEDEKLHAWAEGKGQEPDKVEAKAYELATAEAKKQGKGDKIPGGKADDKPKSDFDPKQMVMGKKVEREHTTDSALAAEIATDHLEEIPDYYSRLKKMEDAAPKQAGLLQQEEPVSMASPLTQVSPDILQLIKAQALIDQQKLAYPNDTGDVRVPYQREPERPDVAEETQAQQLARQEAYERQLAEQMRAQRIEHEYTGKVRRGELFGGLGGLAAGAGLGYALSKPGGRFFPMAAGGAVAGLLGKGLGRHIGQKQGLDYLQQYTGVPWAVQ